MEYIDASQHSGEIWKSQIERTNVTMVHNDFSVYEVFNLKKKKTDIILLQCCILDRNQDFLLMCTQCTWRMDMAFKMPDFLHLWVSRSGRIWTRWECLAVSLHPHTTYMSHQALPSSANALCQIRCIVTTTTFFSNDCDMQRTWFISSLEPVPHS